ncbi:hypothetical protein HDU87_008605 [Geranomyces variabilis]|uniref:Uncharacterized protein n=1 Tax=Geranomyces variabilis TaxID=109894 RepID=A0AAD5TRV5_9FUNG|nr:hypothetical protein HDU87_008605 [Geranomyces variabilis]
MESGEYNGPVPTAIKNKDHGVDDDGLTISTTVVLNGEIPLKFWENAKDKALKKGGVRQTTNAHYSLICTESMSEATFLGNLRHSFQMPQVYALPYPRPAAGLADLTADWEGASDLDGPVRIVHKAAVQLAPPMLGMDGIDVAGLHQGLTEI